MSNNLDDEINSLINEINNNHSVNIKKKVDEIAEKVKPDEEEEKKPEMGENDVRTQLSKMTIAGKVKAAMFGDMLVRSILIQDSNKMIQQFVLKNPQLSIDEIEDFARNPQTPKGVLRAISTTDTWTKNYAVKQALVFNPKSPLEISMKWVRFMGKADLKKLSRSKNVPQTLATIVKKKMETMRK